MIGSYQQIISDTEEQLEVIKKWISKNSFHVNVKFLVSYAIIKSSGTIETIYKQIVFNHLVKNANDEAIKFLDRNILESSSNPSTGQIEKMLESVNGKWAEEFKQRVKDGNIKSDLNSLVQLRNDFAHGKDVIASIETVMTYFRSAKQIMKILDEIVG